MAQEKRIYPDVNQATVIGSVIRQELRYTPNGKAVLRVVLGVVGEVYEYVPIKVLGASAERLADRLQEVFNPSLWVQGRLSFYRKEGARDSVELLADRVEIIRPRDSQLTVRPDSADSFLIGGENRVMLSGMVATEPEPRTLPDGEEALRFRLASRLESGESGFVTVGVYSSWGIELGLSRGNRVVVVGRYRTYSTVDNSGGDAPERRYHSEVRAQGIWPLVLPGEAAYRKSASPDANDSFWASPL